MMDITGIMMMALLGLGGFVLLVGGGLALYVWWLRRGQMKGH